MRSADEARAAMQSFDPEKLPQFKKWESAIESAIAQNKASVYLTGLIDTRLGIYLRQLGYKVEVFDDRNELVTSVSWE